MRYYTREIPDTGLTFVAIIPDSSMSICRFRVYSSELIANNDISTVSSRMAVWDVIYSYDTETLWDQFYYVYNTEVEPSDRKNTLLGTDKQGYTCFGVSQLDMGQSAIITIWDKLHDILDEFKVEQLLD